MSTEREDLLALQTHPGWLRLLQYAKDQWGVKAYAQRLEAAEDPMQIKAIKMAHGWLNELCAYPVTRVAELERQAAHAKEPASLSRGGQ